MIVSRSLRFCLAVSLMAGWSAGAAEGPEPPVAAPPAAVGLGLLEAVRLTLARDPNVAIGQARLQGAQGALAFASGQFDPVVTSGLTQEDTRSPETLSSSSRTQTLHSTLGVTQQFRTGLSVTPGLDLLRSRDVPGGAGNAGTVTFLIRQPLLRGRGRAATEAAELSAGRDVTAAGLDARQVVAQRIVVVASQYWTVAAAASNLEVLASNEASSRDLLENTRKLIAADQVPAAELVQLEANLAAAESARIGGERLLFTARQDLGREIGLDGPEIARLPLPADPFPAVDPAAVPPPEAAAGLVTEAMARRDDLRAARERLTGSELLRRAAENALKPQVDLILAPSYSGLDQGFGATSFFSPLYRNVPGASTSVGLAFSWPTLNRRAEGTLLQIESARRQDALAVDLVAKAIGADVPAALDSVTRDARQLDRAREAVRLFERAVSNEEKKLRAGTSTLLDLINQRDRLVAARQTVVSAQLSLALSILELRFQTGTLFGDEGEAAELQYARLTTLPAPSGAGSGSNGGGP